MEYLRWILLVVAVVVVLLVYLRSRVRKQSSMQSPLDAANDVPSFSAGEQRDESWVDGVGPVRVVNKTEDVAPVSISAKNPFDDADVDESPGESMPPASQTVEQFWNDGEVEQYETEAPTEPMQTPPAEEIIDTHPAESINETESTSAEQQASYSSASDKSQQAVTDDDVIVLYVVADRNQEMRGEQVLSATIAAQLEFGEMNIFHRHDSNGKTLFSMASISEPGYFDIEQMNDTRTRGLSLFIQLGLCDDPVYALDEMLLTAHTLASMLNGKMCDADRQLLNETVARSLREKASYYGDKKLQQQAEPSDSH